jgi:tryptophan 2,3-dioxygenase
MGSYADAEQRMRAAISELHDYLWGGARPDEAKLLAQLQGGARNLDRHLGAQGRVERAIRPITRRFRKVTQGADLYTFLHTIAHLSFAADRVRRSPKEAAKAASQVAISLCIHLASAAKRFDLVESFETGHTDFAEFTSKLADALEERGVLRAGEFRRATNQAFDVNALWDRRASTDAKRIMGAASVASAGFACVLFIDALRSLGRYRETPYARLIPVVGRILRAVGSHP